ncbi:AAC(3) family N-acetyltransferase [Halobellus ordinarius]|uniref:AAC(3) family N-acetyltransferase n=1 Tax=Halobellus ordinarius TaxID=3075120 RepID=UPI002880118F|nr:AAC(3) family N-acetyltransferase [Halobellus sp. ZY16]
MPPDLLTNASRGANLIKHQSLKRAKQRRGASQVPEARFDDVLDRHAEGHSEVFVHVGLSDVKGAFATNPYEFLRSKLNARFESVLAPGFTDYFATSGVYHKQYSRPKHGTFSQLFLDDADYRTDDAMKSILVEGEYRFDDCVHHDSYHPEGCFAKLVEEDTLVLDVGTPWLTCSHLHYFESRFDVPYLTERTFEGVMYTDETDCERIEQTCSIQPSPFYSWNKPKLTRRLDRDGALDRYDLNGLKVLFFTLGDLQSSLAPRLRADPYYLVTL